MKKHYGKIMLSIVFISLILSVIALLALKVQAADKYAPTTMTIPNLHSPTNQYLILYNIKTGELVNASDGSFGATWANAAFDKSHWTNQTQTAITGWPVYLIPGLTRGVTYGFVLCDGTSPVKTDNIRRSGLYDPSSGITYTPTVPVTDGEVRVRQLQN